MSTVIEGFKYSGSLNDLYSDLKTINQKIISENTNDILKLIMSDYENIYYNNLNISSYFNDTIKKYNIDINENYSLFSNIFDIYDIIIKEQIFNKCNVYNDFKFNLISTVYIYLYDNDIYLITSLNTNLKSNLKTLPNIQNFNYWDNTDKPDDISDIDWNNRGKIWETLLYEDFKLTYNIYNNIYFDFFDKFKPNFKERFLEYKTDKNILCKNIAKKFTLNKIYLDLYEKDDTYKERLYSCLEKAKEIFENSDEYMIDYISTYRKLFKKPDIDINILKNYK
jgi:hypothetical protein